MLSAIDQENGELEKPSNQVVFSLDAVSLYPSMECEETASICARMITQSGLLLEPVDWEEAGLYLVLTGNRGSVPNDCLPQRKFSTGPSPMITTAEVLGPTDIAKLSPNSNFSWGLSWLYCQLIQPLTRPSTRV